MRSVYKLHTSRLLAFYFPPSPFHTPTSTSLFSSVPLRLGPMGMQFKVSTCIISRSLITSLNVSQSLILHPAAKHRRFWEGCRRSGGMMRHSYVLVHLDAYCCPNTHWHESWSCSLPLLIPFQTSSIGDFERLVVALGGWWGRLVVRAYVYCCVNVHWREAWSCSQPSRWPLYMPHQMLYHLLTFGLGKLWLWTFGCLSSIGNFKILRSHIYLYIWPSGRGDFDLDS